MKGKGRPETHGPALPLFLYCTTFPVCTTFQGGTDTNLATHADMAQYTAPEFTVKITVTGYRSHLVEETVYYRYKVPFEHTIRFRWYFDWLAALVKAGHPHRTVRLEILRRDENSVLCGEDFLKKALPDKIKALKAKITAERNKASRTADLFGFAGEKADEKIRAYQERISAYEKGEYDGYVPPTYINRVKKWIQPEK